MTSKNHLCASGIIVREGRVLLGHRMYDALGAWIAPGGRCEIDESPETALLREIAEEIGITDAKIIRKLGDKEGTYQDETGRDKVILFEVTTTQNPRLMEPKKFKTWKWFNMEEMPDNLLDEADKKFFMKAIYGL